MERIKLIAIELGGDAVRGLFGMASVGTGAYISLQNVEIWLRIGSLLVGIGVGVITFISIAYSLYRKIKGLEK